MWSSQVTHPSAPTWPSARVKKAPLSSQCFSKSAAKGPTPPPWPIKKKQVKEMKWSDSHSVMSDSLWPIDCSWPGSSVHRILQERILEWVAIPFSRGSSWPRVSVIAGGFFNYLDHQGSLTQWVRNLPAMQETQEMQVQPMDREDPLEKEMATHSSILAWKNPLERGTWWTIVQRVTKSQTQLSDKDSELEKCRTSSNLTENTGADCHFLLPEIKPVSPALQADSLPFEPQGSPLKKENYS